MSRIPQKLLIKMDGNWTTISQPSFKGCGFVLAMAAFACPWYAPKTNLTAFETWYQMMTLIGALKLLGLDSQLGYLVWWGVHWMNAQIIKWIKLHNLSWFVKEDAMISSCPWTRSAPTCWMKHHGWVHVSRWLQKRPLIVSVLIFNVKGMRINDR